MICDLPDDLHLDVWLGGDSSGGGGRGRGGGGGEPQVLRGDESPSTQAHHQPRVVHQDQVQLHRSHPGEQTERDTVSSEKAEENTVNSEQAEQDTVNSE